MEYDSLYAWIKRDPKRVNVLMSSWKNVPESFWKDWKWLKTNSGSWKDSTLWCYSLIQAENKKGCKLFWRASWLHDRMYTLQQQEKVLHHHVRYFIKFMDDAFVIVARNIELDVLADCITRYRNTSASQTLYTVLTGERYPPNQDIIDTMFTTCTLDMIIRNREKIDEIEGLLRDTVNEDCVTWTSLSKLREAHDAQAARAIQEKLATVKENYFQFSPRLHEIVQEHGYRILTKEKDFVERGMDHHNCVANYYSRLPSPELLLIARKDVTCEIRFKNRKSSLLAFKLDRSIVSFFIVTSNKAQAP